VIVVRSLWCVVCGQTSLVFGLWSDVSGVLLVVRSLWYFACGQKSLVFCLWSEVSGILLVVRSGGVVRKSSDHTQNTRDI
jgi:hypothetical protein